MKPIGKALKELRVAKNLSQQKVIRAVKFNQSYASRVECGLMTPTNSYIDRYLSAIKCSELQLAVQRLEPEDYVKNTELASKLIEVARHVSEAMNELKD